MAGDWKHYFWLGTYATMDSYRGLAFSKWKLNIITRKMLSSVWIPSHVLTYSLLCRTATNSGSTVSASQTRIRHVAAGDVVGIVALCLHASARNYVDSSSRRGNHVAVISLPYCG